MGGRDFRPQATTMALLMLILTVALRRGLRWAVIDLLLAILVVEIITLSVIASFSGLTWLAAFDSFNLSWLVFMNWFIGLPWLVGLMAGSLWLGASHHGARDAAP
jgi:hypothetical protein